MYNIITAIGNETLNNEIKETGKYNVVFGDIAYQEALLEVVKKNKIDKVILLDTLVGELEKIELIDEILNIKENIDIIVILEEEDKKFTKYLLAKGIYKNLISDAVTLEDICKLIDEEKSESILPIEIDSYQNKKLVFFDKQIIVVNGTTASGKTTFLVNLAIILCNEKKRVLIIDLDTITASVDKFLNIPLFNKNILLDLDDDKKCVLNFFVDCIQKDIFDFDIFDKTVVKYVKSKNLDIITGNNSMYICQNVLCNKYYDEILCKAKQLYDYILIDTNSSLFLDSTKWALENADIIYYLFEGTYKDIANIKNTLLIFEKVWNIYIKKVHFIQNKYFKSSLLPSSIETIIPNINIRQVINFNEKYIESLNNGMPFVLQNYEEKCKYEKILGIENKTNILEIIKEKIRGVFYDNKSIK